MTATMTVKTKIMTVIIIWSIIHAISRGPRLVRTGHLDIVCNSESFLDIKIHILFNTCYKHDELIYNTVYIIMNLSVSSVNKYCILLFIRGVQISRDRH